MEEVDSIILHFLRQLSINVDDDTKSLCDLPVQTIVEAASKCVHTINPSLKVPTKLPSGVSQRIELAAQIASSCKDLGYQNDVGYQTFLYYNEAELRQVFMFLIERLPSEGTQTKSQPTTNKKSILLQNIGQKIGEEINSIWIPPCCNAEGRENIGDYHQPTVYSKSTHKVALTAEEIIEKLQKVKSSSKISKQTNDVGLKHNTPEDVKPVSETVSCEVKKSLKELKEIAIVLRQKLDTLESERNVMDVEYSQAQKASERVEADLNNIQNIMDSIGVLYPEGSTDNLLQKIQKNTEELHSKSEELTSRCLSLKVEIDKLKNVASESERSRSKVTLLNLKANAKAMKAEYESKQEIRDQLKLKYEKLKGGNKRFIYTKRIMEIISNVDKQNLEIQKILEDTRQLQKEINMLEGQLDRCFSIADETLFKDAKKDDQAKKAYKLLALLHSECNSIVSLVNDTGSLERDIVDLEDNIKTETAKNTEHTLKKVQHDLDRMQQETL